MQKYKKYPLKICTNVKKYPLKICKNDIMGLGGIYVKKKVL